MLLSFINFTQCVCVCVSALTFLARQHKGHPACKTELWGTGVVICPQQGATGPADVTATPTFPASLKSRMVLPFWYRLTQVVLEKRSLNWCSSSRLVLTTLLHLFSSS